MSMSSALNNAVSGLTAASRMAEVVSSNLSNALTESYGRRSVNLSAAQVGGTGAGVRIDGITRFSDPGLLADRRLADAALNGQKREAESLLRLETELGGVDGATGLSARMSAFEKAMISASGDPASATRLTNAVVRLSDLTGALQGATRSTQMARQDADAAIAADVGRLNSGLRQVADLNVDILRIMGSGNDPSALLDARQRLIDDIATIVPVRELPRADGTVGLMTVNGTTLLDLRPVQIGFLRTPVITADMTVASGALSGLTLNNVTVDPGIGRLAGGSLGAHFTLRDQTMVGVQAGLDQIAADLMLRLSDRASDPTIPQGGAGLLTDGAGAFDPADLTGLAGRIAVNAAIDPAKGGAPALLRDGLFATTPGPLGNSDQLNRWIGALSEPKQNFAADSLQSAAGRIAGFTAQLGAKRLIAEESASFSMARWDNLRAAELANGVDTDFELQVLLRVEQAYAANSKVIQTVNFMMQQLMEI